MEGQRSLKKLYIRELFHKMMKRLKEDESSIWYDKLEQESEDFKEIKDLYDKMVAKAAPNQLHSESVLKRDHDTLVHSLVEESKS